MFGNLIVSFNWLICRVEKLMLMLSGGGHSAPWSSYCAKDRSQRKTCQNVQDDVRRCVLLRFPYKLRRRQNDRICSHLRQSGLCQEIWAQVPTSSGMILMCWCKTGPCAECSSAKMTFLHLGFPRLLESPGFFSWKLQDQESPWKLLWSWKVLEKYPSKSCIFLNCFYNHCMYIERLYVNKFLSEFWTANVHILLHAEFSAMDYTLNIVSKCRFFFIFKHSRAPKMSWKIFHGGPGKSWTFCQ